LRECGCTIALESKRSKKLGEEDDENGEIILSKAISKDHLYVELKAPLRLTRVNTGNKGR
jgi:hypothetical protein